MKYDRVYNFSAGPAMMPEPVLEEIAAEVLNYHGSGMSVMEMSHRSKVFQDILAEAEADLRTLMNIPENYKILFVQGMFISVRRSASASMWKPAPGAKRPLPKPSATVR